MSQDWDTPTPLPVQKRKCTQICICCRSENDLPVSSQVRGSTEDNAAQVTVHRWQVLLTDGRVFQLSSRLDSSSSPHSSSQSSAVWLHRALPHHRRLLATAIVIHCVLTSNYYFKIMFKWQYCNSYIYSEALFDAFTIFFCIVRKRELKIVK